VLIEAFTYRMDAHTTSDDPTRYRLADELELWKLKDPIERVRVNLVREHGIGQEFFSGVQAESDALAARFREYCVNMPPPAPDRMFSQVYAEGSTTVDAQRQEYLAYHESFESHGSPAVGGGR
jgi:pyruvate dehydrogenase E1 component alpha subunit